MRIDTIELHVGEPDFPYQPIRHLEVKSESRTAFSPAPTHDAVNAQFRDLASQVGADAVIQIQYSKGVSMTSWNSMKGTGLAVRRLRDGATTAPPASTVRTTEQPGPRPHHVPPEPLRSTDNNRGWMLAVGAFLVLMMIVAALGS